MSCATEENKMQTITQVGFLCKIIRLSKWFIDHRTTDQLIGYNILLMSRQKKTETGVLLLEKGENSFQQTKKRWEKGKLGKTKQEKGLSKDL